MNNSYKVALISAAVLCVIVIAYYVMRDNDAPAISSDSSVAPTSETSTAEAPPIRSLAPSQDSRSSLLDRIPERSGSAPLPSERSSNDDLLAQVRGITSRDGVAANPSPSAAAPHPIGRDTPATSSPDAAQPPEAGNVITFGPGPTPPARTTPAAPAAPLSTVLPATGSSVSSAPAATPVRPPVAVIPPTQVPAAPVAAQTYTIREGDTFSSIAEQLTARYGKRVTWVHVAQANPTLDPDRIRPGQVIKLPSAARPSPPAAPRTGAIAGATGTTRDGAPTYVVRAGDSLTSIARQYYRSEKQWQLLYDANRNIIGPNPDRVREGMRLVIPPAPTPAR